MTTKRRRYDERNHQVTWEDVEPWVQQLYEDHGVYVRFEVVIIPPSLSCRSGVTMRAYRVLVSGKTEAVKDDYKLIALRDVGLVEKHSLQMVSLLLLELENDKAAAEARQGSLWA